MVRETKKGRFRGINIVETAVVLPLIFLLIFGLIEYGWLFFKMHLVTNAARVGARVAVRPTSNYGTVKAVVDDLMAKANISVYNVFATDENGNVLSNDAGSSPAVGSPIKVEIEVTVNEDISILRFPSVLLPEKLYATVIMAREGP
jgi:hypothetical protein